MGGGEPEMAGNIKPAGPRAGGGGGSAGQLILQKWIPVTHFVLYVALAH